MILHEAAKRIRQNAEQIAYDIVTEIGKPTKLAMKEVLGVADVIDFLLKKVFESKVKYINATIRMNKFK